MTLATAAAGHSPPVSPPAKRSRGDYLCQFEDDADATPVVPDEVSNYLQTRMMTSEDILHWWRVNSSSYPCLATVAKGILPIPTSERSFSAADCTISPRRTALDSETVEDILFVHSNA